MRLRLTQKAIMKLPNFSLRKKPQSPPPRITNETVAEHRERILAGGRRFKYPVQYGRRRLVVNTIIISLAAVILTVAFGWWQLYIVQNTSNFFYQVTKVLPLPVAKIDGQSVRYSDYLMQYRSSIHFSENIEGLDLDNENGEQQKNYYKRLALDNATTESYAEKLAKELNITVSKQEVEDLLDQHMNADGQKVSRQAYTAAINEMYGWNEEEYLRTLERQLLRQKVSAAIDEEAKKLKDELEEKLNPDGSNFEKVAEEYEGRIDLSAPGKVPHGTSDRGQAGAALTLEPGNVSKPFVSRSIDGYYFVKLLDKTDKEVNYRSIKVPLKELTRRLKSVRDAGKVREHIKVPKVEAPANRE